MNHNHTESLGASEFDRLLSHASQEPDFVFLGSTASHGNPGRYQFFSARAETRFNLDRTACATGFGPTPANNLSRELASLAARFQADVPSVDVAFPGGWIGFVSYEFGYLREQRLEKLCPETPAPVFCAGLFLWIASYDRETGQHTLFIHPGCSPETVKLITHWRSEQKTQSSAPWHMPRPFEPTQTREAYLGRLQQIIEYIHAGDCYQTNLSQQFQGTYRGDPWLAFQALGQAHPTPFSAFIRQGGQSLLSLSPERFLEIQGGRVETSPIKGTRRRGKTPEQDAQLAQELRDSVKDQAENLMIVDLLRNDLNVNCQPGTVKVDRLFALESYQNVHHLVSHIRGELKPGFSPLRALLDAFPGGSITGAPKIRAMEIIRELEPHWRGPYCGSVFYWSLNGRLDSNIAIRTLLCDDEGNAWCWGGGGIVADSDPQAEYEETLTKVRPLMDFLENLE